MRNKRILSLKLSLLLLCIGSIGWLDAQQISIIPAPQNIRFTTGYFDLHQSISLQNLLKDEQEIALLEGQLTHEIQHCINEDFQFSSGSPKGNIILGLKGFNDSFTQILQKSGLDLPKSIGQEGYQIKVTDSKIIVAAISTKGLFYGVQSLRQLIRTNRTTGKIPGLLITDWPDLEIRGMMDDISRGPVPTTEYMHQQIERMSEMKVNMLTYYTQDVVKIKSHPEFAPPGGALSIEEWKELSDYAKKYHIDLVGNFQSFGHFDQILKHKEFAHLGENGTLLSPAFEESYQLLEDIYEEMIPAFHSKYFHINSDETFDLGTGASKEMVDSLGYDVVYANHIKRIHDIITPMGKTIMVWGDLALKHPTLLDLLPKDVILVNWDYDIQDDYSLRILPIKEAGYKQLISTGVLNSKSIMPDFNIAKGNISGFVEEAVKQNIWGMLNTIWDDGGSALFSKDWYGVAYAADQSWNSNPTDESYDHRFNQALYGSTNNGLTDALRELNRLSNIKSTEKMNEAIFWDKIIPEKGKSRLINISDGQQVSEIVENANKALEQYDPIIYSKDKDYIQLTINQYKHLADSRPALVSASEAYKKAVKIQKTNPIEARRQLVNAYQTLATTYSTLVDIKQSNSSLWLRENRVYAWERIATQYNQLISDLTEVQDSLMSATFTFDSGELLPKSEEIRINIKKTDGWYFRGWLMVEPIPNPLGYKSTGIDYLESTGGISKTFPFVTEEFYFNDKKYRWKRVNTPYFAKVDLEELYPDSENTIMHAFAHIDVSKNQRVRALVGSSDGVEVYVNGILVHQNIIKRNFKVDVDELFLPLKKGRNHLMVKISNGEGDGGFSFRLPDVEVRSSKNRYKILD